MSLINCQHCKKKYATSHTWFECNNCGFRICAHCISKHGTGFKCSQCTPGIIKKK
jgi:hypothetical protein